MYITILTTIAVFGAFAVSRGRPLTANYLWITSNPLMAIYNYNIEEYQMAAMFTIYSMIAIYGIWNLKIKNKESAEAHF